MKHKPILCGTALAVIMLLSISRLVFAANATNTSPNSANGDVEVRTDLAPGGKTANQLEFWQADEFESWLEQERILSATCRQRRQILLVQKRR